MKRIFVLFFAVILCALCAAALRAEVKVTPVADVTCLAGQSFSTSGNGALGGNLDVFFTPAVNFSPATALLPIITLNYRGTKDVQELVGGGTLTQECLDISPVTLKLVHKFNSTLEGKFRIGTRTEYVKETKDETWQKGLFDYNKVIGGFEFEKYVGMFSIKAGYDYYTMRYPNYSSLVSEDSYASSIDTTTFQEISRNAGVNVLDYDASALFYEYERGLSKKALINFNYTATLKAFKDQSVIISSAGAGVFSDENRRDWVHAITLKYDTALNEKSTLNITDAIIYYDSKQNSYDGYRARFLPDFYGFFDNALISSLTMKTDSRELPGVLKLSLDIGYRCYRNRLTQDETTGDYLTDKIWQFSTALGVSYVRPLSKRLSVVGNLNYKKSFSNMTYAGTYSYNYYVANYFVGIDWAY